ncbi:uncharacterized protein TRIADDRAFT_28544 [Trichoplax adhaerens]|uniref:Alpha-ketoglutarate-dependent dioxygenase AlkB-like domain-containing protein n=1 Tax=Trichoplax adhaerens TaxID=10228 RepID=B3S3R8_TRIAD|nr:hypothetical protein TRIADDRAFT_28544 [Trichoplax adhaerens]EDV22328.1 hypothetical protein TRIADDRAFT_28544 [Trichoplax adhaerens]|eukprot:XP_002114872.1 hypothetical protein TRIADDRAFT_28544 [Trichoplax adhaerens]
MQLRRHSITCPLGTNLPHYLYSQDEAKAKNLAKDMLVLEDFITQEEEELLFSEIQPAFKRLKYEYSHWDDAIHGFRETEKTNWSSECNSIIARVRETAFDSNDQIMPFVHILDLAENGYIKAHVDSIKFCGRTIAGISLLSASIMRLKLDGKPDDIPVDILLQRRSLYIMKDSARYDYTHEILKDEESHWKGVHIPRSRRISVIRRIEPSK